MCLEFVCEWSLNSPYSMTSLGQSDYGDQTTQVHDVTSCLGFLFKL